MRSPPEDKTRHLKRFSYRREDSDSSDGGHNYQNSWSQPPKYPAAHSEPVLGNSDLDVIWSIQKNNPDSRDRLTCKSPPHMKGFYSRYTSQDPRFASQLGGSIKDSKGSGGFELSHQSTSKYSYSQDKRPSRFSGYDTSTDSKQRTTELSMHEASNRTPGQYKQAGRADRSSPLSREGQHSSSSWDDF